MKRYIERHYYSVILFGYPRACSHKTCFIHRSIRSVPSHARGTDATLNPNHGNHEIPLILLAQTIST